jgi:hypothetical protein
MLSRLAFGQIRRVTPVGFGSDDPTVARVYRQAEREFGILAPPLALHAAAPPTLAAMWLMMREAMIVDGVVSRSAKEAVASAVSLGNSCPYCLSVHSGALTSLTPGRDGSALAGGAVDSMADPQLRALAQWGRTSGDRRAAQRPAPFPAAQGPELIGVAVLLHYVNRMVNVFLSATPLPPGAPRLALGPVLRILGAVMRRAGRIATEPGTSLDLLPDAPAPPDLAWAAGNPTIAAAFARAGAAVAAAGDRSVPAGVRDLVTAELARWDGQPRGISRSWVDEAVSRLPETQRPAGRLALLVAFASYQVDQRIVDGFRATQPGDRELIELASWSSLAAARRIGSWLHAREASTLSE